MTWLAEHEADTARNVLRRERMRNIHRFAGVNRPVSMQAGHHKPRLNASYSHRGTCDLHSKRLGQRFNRVLGARISTGCGTHFGPKHA